MEYIIKNGIVYDPINGVNGEKMDICVKDGKIVEKVSEDAKVIDASNCVVMAGGIEIHSHLAGPKVNIGRMMRPEDSIKEIYAKKGLRCGTGFSIPSTFKTGYQYCELGYTFALEAAMPPLKARHVHEEFLFTPQIDVAALPLFGNNWIVFKYIMEKDYKALAAYVAWMLKATKGYGIKIVNPGGTEAWGWGTNVHSLDDPVPGFDITPKEIVKGLGMVNELLGLPHSIHVHPNDLGHPGNYEVTIETMKLLEDVKAKPKIGERWSSYHNTHIQFHAYGGTSWKDFESKALEIIDYVNKSKHVTIDVGQVTLDETTTMTADGPMEYDLYMMTKFKWANCDVELETGSGVVPFIYSRKNPVHSVQWAIGLEFLLYTDTDKVILTTDHPNAGPFTRYPRILAWLLSKKYREDWLYNKVHKWARERTALPDADKEYDMYEVAKVTRANQAIALGLSESMGHLGVGANADIAIYEIDPEEKDGKKIEKAFRYAKYVLKDGEVIVKDGEIVKEKFYRTFYLDVQVDESLMNEVLKDVEEMFKRYYTINFENYVVTEEYANNWKPIKIDATNL
ncbi:formylmethanofuran dehydrogenase subunit A [Methanocaldococcus infernus ME]|uniref:Formylmethanofuran dehydrogenase subunit A n=1 Tax=Methanocaldococcus infernus (strain DSM 11812 / JCM 15783 / ME) TaxID=573063 RepID=D5VT83_METIM|nr:tungsten-dependent formylmethanofuran dehydrogenase subunit FwdA [Methanocaldococcus infernus]ADG13786.1 formylmethanofuran dehydrogenase subunit A [Methanocaldococcus infernus ME]